MWLWQNHCLERGSAYVLPQAFAQPEIVQPPDLDLTVDMSMILCRLNL